MPSTTKSHPPLGHWQSGNRETRMGQTVAYPPKPWLIICVVSARRVDPALPGRALPDRTGGMDSH
jgi:hypothetical protein